MRCIPPAPLPPLASLSPPPLTDVCASSMSTPSSSQQQRPSATPPMRPTTKQFLDWERKREQAQQAMKSKVEPDKVRYPTAKYAGNLFSESMPVGPQRGVGPGWKTPPSPSSTPQGLSSINRVSGGAGMGEWAEIDTLQASWHRDLGGGGGGGGGGKKKGKLRSENGK